MTQTMLKTAGEAAPFLSVTPVADTGTAPDVWGASESGVIDVPAHLHASIDALLDYYAENGLKPEITVGGNPLDAISTLIVKVEETIPAHLVAEGKDILDYLVRAICDFGRARAMNSLNLTFHFDRGNGGVTI